MRKTIMSVLVAMACSTMMAENKMTASDVTINAGEDAELTVGIENDMDVAAFDFRLYLPSGISVAWDDELEDYAWDWCDRVPKNKKGSFFDLQLTTTDDNSLLFGANSGTSEKVLDGNSGPVLTITLHAAATAKNGTAQLKRIAFSNADGTQTATPEDVTFNITVIPATGISSPQMENGKSSNGECYNLAGQRMSKPTKGVNIQNGRKVVIK